MLFSKILSVVALLCYNVSASVLTSSPPGPPATDPFYQPPSGFASTTPGTILRSRQVEIAIFGDIPDPVQAYQLLYRTTAINGSAIAGMTTVLVPTNAESDSFVSFQSAEDSAASQCATSYNLLLGSNQTNPEIEILIIELYLLSGYIVSAVDDEGPDSAFSAGHLEGMVVLDSMRAVQNFAGVLELSQNPAIVGVGYSGGSIATGWAASLHHVYAPELNVVGWSMGGTPANLTGTLMFIDDTPASGFGPTALAGHNKPSAYYDQLNPFLDGILTSYGSDKLTYATENCASADLNNFEDLSILSPSFQSLAQDLLYNSLFADMLAESTMGVNATERPRAPVFMYHGVEDEIVPYEYAKTLFHNWCEQGVAVEFTSYGEGGHVAIDAVGAVPALLFANNAFGGVAGSICQQNDIATQAIDVAGLSSQALVALVEKLANALPEAQATNGLLRKRAARRS